MPQTTLESAIGAIKNQVVSIKRPEKDGIDLAYISSRFERGSEEQLFLKQNAQMIGRILNQSVNDAFNYVNHALEDINHSLSPSLLINKEFQLRVFKDLYINFTKPSSNNFTSKALEANILAKLTYKTGLRILVIQASKISDEYFEFSSDRNKLDEIEKLKIKISNFDPKLKMEDLEKKVESLKLEIIEIKKEKLKIESNLIDVNKLEFPQSLLSKYYQQGINLTNFKILINQIDLLILAGEEKKENSNFGSLSLNSFKRSLLQFIMNPTISNLEKIQNKSQSFNNNPFLSSVRGLYLQTFYNLKVFKVIELSDVEKKLFEDNKKEILNVVESKDHEINLKNRKIEEYKFYPKIFQLQTQIKDIEIYYQNNQLSLESIEDLQNRIKISKVSLVNIYSQIINGNSELFGLSLKEIKTYSQNYPKTIEAYLNLVLNSTKTDIKAIHFANKNSLQMAFVRLNQVVMLHKTENQETLQDLYESVFMNEITL